MFGGEDLEDIILRDKIPGRYSTWERGDTEPEKAWAGDEDLIESEEEEEDAEPVETAGEDPRLAGSRGVPPVGAGPMTGPQTGVKGVLNHAYDQKLWEAEHQKLNAQKRNFLLYRSATGKGQMQVSAKEAEKQEKVELSDDDEFDDSDDEFMREFRAKRLQELQLGAAENALAQTAAERADTISNGTKLFGQLREIDPMDLPDEVDCEASSVNVIVHLHEPYIRACAYLTKALKTLAVKYPSIKFLNLQAGSCSKMDPVALPIINIYQAGKVKVCLTRVNDLVGRDDCNIEDVEWLLESHGVQFL